MAPIERNRCDNFDALSRNLLHGFLCMYNTKLLVKLWRCITSLWWVKWQFEMVMAVEPWMASMSPSWQLDMEMWSIQMLADPKMEIPSPSAAVRKPMWSTESLIMPPELATMSCMWSPWMITFWANCIVIPAPLAMWTLAPRPSMVLWLVNNSSWDSLMTMLRENVIQSGFFWITAWRRVPGFGLWTLLSEGSLTT